MLVLKPLKSSSGLALLLALFTLCVEAGDLAGGLEGKEEEGMAGRTVLRTLFCALRSSLGYLSAAAAPFPGLFWKRPLLPL